MNALESSYSADRPSMCPSCGSAVRLNWLFCGFCGHQLVDISSSPLPTDVSPLCRAEKISATELPDVSGVPGRIVGVRISHGWAAACGYYDIHEVVDGKAVKTRRVSPARGGGLFPPGWFDDQSVKLDDTHRMRLEAILQNVRYCDIGKRHDGTTVIETRDSCLSMRVMFEDFQGDLKYFDFHADAECGLDVGSCCARDVIREIEAVFGNKRALDCLLIIHRIGPRLRVVMNGPLYLNTDQKNSSSYSVVDCELGDVLTIEENELDVEERFFEARIRGLRDGWVSRKARFPIKFDTAIRLSSQDFSWGGQLDDTITCDPAPLDNDIVLEDWIIACARCPFIFIKAEIDTAPFLEDYEPLITPGSYALTTWLEGDDQDQESWFSRPIPEKVSMLNPLYPLSIKGVGTFHERRDITMHKIARQIQLEESRYYFLTEYYNEDGTPTGEYSFDMEGEHDSHYSFSDNEVPMLRRSMDARDEDSLADAMIAFIRRCSGSTLSELVWKVRTSSISY